MKRIGNLYQDIASIENLQLADYIAQKGKKNTYGVQLHNQNSEANLFKLQNMLLNYTYKTSEYKVFKVYEPKEREVYQLPYFPDRIAHHAVMNKLENIFVSNFTADTYSCIKGRGIHKASFALRKALRDVPGTKYCLKLDIKKFYPSVDHDILKAMLSRKFKDKSLLWLLNEIIDSAPGLPIGNYLSQYLANFYLSGFDHWIKEAKRVRYYFRYADDLVILSDNKEFLHELLFQIKEYFGGNLRLTVKGNYQVFPVAARGIDFVGYKHFHKFTLLRKSIKKRFAKAVKRKKGKSSIDSYLGWLKHCNSNHLIKKLLPDEQFQRLRHKADN